MGNVKETKFPWGGVISIVIVLLLVVIMTSDIIGNNPNDPGSGEINIAGPKNYYNGVFFFNETGSAYGNSVALFLEDNPDLELLGASSEQIKGYGNTGVWIYTTIPKSLEKNVTSSLQPKDYREGVFYFDAQGDEYGTALSAFRFKHPELGFRGANLENGRNTGTWAYFNKSLPSTPKLKLQIPKA
jgi:hypothetical protein